MPNLQLAAWVTIIAAGSVIVAFVVAEAFLYLLRAHKLARISREPSTSKGPAPQVAGARGGRAVGVPVSSGPPFVARRPGAVRQQVAPPGGPIIDPR